MTHRKAVQLISFCSLFMKTSSSPEFFGEEENVLVLAENTDVNTNQAATHSEIVQNIRKHYNNIVEIFGKPHMIKLPFYCEEQIAQWESQIFHGDELVTAAFGE